MIKYLLIIFLIFFILGCNKSKEDCEINSIIIESRRSYRDKEVLKVTNKKIISEILALHEKSRPIYGTNLVKSNYGFIELYHYCDRSKVNILTVIYTEYNGVLIWSDPREYSKNGRLKDYIEELMNSSH